MHIYITGGDIFFVFEDYFFTVRLVYDVLLVCTCAEIGFGVEGETKLFFLS